MFKKMKWIFISLAVIQTTKIGANSQSSQLLNIPNCSNKQTCHECIQTRFCAWCTMTNFTENRCMQPDSNKENYAICKEEFLYSPDTEYTLLRNKPLTEKDDPIEKNSSGANGVYPNLFTSTDSSRESLFKPSQPEAVQMYPQEVNLKLRINEPYDIHFAYAQAEDYPVDLYCLMDMSKSMEDDKAKLSSLGQSLVAEMQKITKNFRLGFGTFVDKVVMPYVSVLPKHLISPCENCTAPYGYKHVMGLSQNTGRFAELVDDASVSGGLDGPEGGFDAIMQAIVCKNEIGWREQARRLLVFLTDAEFHFAGDGKLGGIVKPNDQLCHLDETGLYTHSSEQDYPSISQINSKVKENAINIIWAITKERLKTYKALSELVEGSYVGKLDNDSRNIVELIRKQYDEISSSVEIKDTSGSAIKIRYFTRGLGNDTKNETNKFDGLKVGTKVDFIARVEVTNCPDNKSEWKQTFQIYPVGIKEALTVNLEMLCDCDCESNIGQEDVVSPKCNNLGTLKCGICECFDGYFGNHCECSDTTGGIIDHTLSCRAANATVDCSGRGTCFCGVCECDKRQNPSEKIGGDYCQCDNFSCDRDKGILCAGHGSCDCGVCSCEIGWTGASCNCRSSNETCIAPGTTNGILCSGHGDCECGICHCHSDDVRYSGRYCNKCLTCPSRCDELNPCVQCLVYKTGNFSSEECEQNCVNFVPETLDVISADVDNDEVICDVIDEKNCRYTFVYYYNEVSELKVKAQTKKDCPSPVFVLGIVFGVIFAVVFVGLVLLLVWKAWIIIEDRREFSKFEKETKKARWDEGGNPIYKRAVSTFENPTYKPKSRG